MGFVIKAARLEVVELTKLEHYALFIKPVRFITANMPEQFSHLVSHHIFSIYYYLAYW